MEKVRKVRFKEAIWVGKNMHTELTLDDPNKIDGRQFEVLSFNNINCLSVVNKKDPNDKVAIVPYHNVNYFLIDRADFMPERKVEETEEPPLEKKVAPIRGRKKKTR